MADENSTEQLRELRRIRIALYLIVLLLCLLFLNLSLFLWAESTRPPRMPSQEAWGHSEGVA